MTYIEHTISASYASESFSDVNDLSGSLVLNIANRKDEYGKRTQRF